MAITDTARALTEILEPVAASHGFELVAVEQVGGRASPIIRVLLDCENGLGIDVICAANVWVSEALEDVSALSGPFTLEVSSPGIDRPLHKLIDFERFTGEKVTIKAKAGDDRRHTWTGTLLGVDGELVLVEVDGERVEIEYDRIVKARLKGVVDFNRERCGE